MNISNVTLSLKVGDMQYGSGSERLVSLGSNTGQDTPEELITDYDSLIEKTMELSQCAWDIIQSSRYAGKVISSEEYQKLVMTGHRRRQQVVAFLKEVSDHEHTAQQPEG